MVFRVIDFCIYYSKFGFHGNNSFKIYTNFIAALIATRRKEIPKIIRINADFLRYRGDVDYRYGTHHGGTLENVDC